MIHLVLPFLNQLSLQPFFSLLIIFFQPTCMSLAKLKSRRIEEVLEEHSGSKIMVGDKANLLLNGLAHLSQQVIFYFLLRKLRNIFM